MVLFGVIVWFQCYVSPLFGYLNFQIAWYQSSTNKGRPSFHLNVLAPRY
jgi:hypothetical protein